MTMRGSWIWLVEIEGLARAVVSSGFGSAVLPMAMTSVPDPGESAFVSGDDGRSCDLWQPVLQPGSVRLSGMTFAPFSGNPAAQTLSFSIAIPDELPEIADYFIPLLVEPVAEITAQINPTDTTISMTDTSSIAAGDVLYSGAECFRVSSVDSSTQVTIFSQIPGATIWPESQNANTGNRGADGVVGRIGAIGSRMAVHAVPGDVPPPWPDTRIYTSNTRVRGRRVYLRRVSWGLDQDGNYGYREQLFGQFLITKAEINSDATTVSVDATSLVASYAKAQLGARPVADRVQAFTQGQSFPYALIDYDVSTDAWSRRIWNGTTAAYATASEGLFLVAVDSTTQLGSDVAGLGIITSRTLGLKPFPTTNLRSGEITEGFLGGQTGLAVKEVLLSDPLLTSRDSLGYESQYPATATDHPYYSADKPGGAGILTHPLHLMLAHLGQLSSNLPYHWQLRLDTSAVSTEFILQLAETVNVNEWPGICTTGPVKAMEWLADVFLRPIGCGWASDEYGRLTVASVANPRLSPWASPNTVAGTDVVPEVSVESVQMGRQVLRVVEAEAGVTQASTGQGLGKEPRLTIQSADAWQVADGDLETSTFTINAMGALSPDDSSDNLSVIDTPTVSFVRTLTSTVGTYLRSGSIQYVLTVPSGYTDEEELFQPFNVLGPAMPSRYALPGTLVQLADEIPGLRKPAGRRIGLVMGHEWLEDCTAQRLRILDAGSVVRIAAAGRVVSAAVESGQLAIVLVPSFEVTPTPYIAQPFGSIIEDGETLAAFATALGEFEYVRFYDSSLAEQNPGAGNEEQVDSYDSATNTLTTSYNAGYVPVAGDFVLFSSVSDVDDKFAFIGSARFTL